MNYHQTVAYLYSRLPMFTRVGISAFKKDLTNTIALCSHLGDPQLKFNSIHVGGTNGKGSTSHMLAAILQTAGYKTGLYTSPHLLDFRERIRVNGSMIPEENVIRFTEELKETIEEINPSFFEVTVAMAFDHFARQQVDIAVIEVGLGGRLDSTNVIRPLAAVITNISYDHMNILGNSLAEIAAEKAGIIKKGIPVVIGEKQDEVAGIFISKASGSGSPLRFASEEWDIKQMGGTEKNNGLLETEVIPFHPAAARSAKLRINLDLTASYQLKNLATVLSAAEELRRQGFIISNDHIKTALCQVQRLTGLAGRWQKIGTSPLIICDTGHNEDGIREVVKNISSTPYLCLHLVIGMVKDKDTCKILELLPQDATYYFCQPGIERAKPVDELESEAARFALHGKSYTSVSEALDAARKNAGADDLIFVGGSTFVVAEVLSNLPEAG